MEKKSYGGVGLGVCLIIGALVVQGYINLSTAGYPSDAGALLLFTPPALLIGGIVAIVKNVKSNKGKK